MNNMNRKFQTGLVITIIAIVLLFMLGQDAISMIKSPIELNDIMESEKVKDLKTGDHVIINVKLAYESGLYVYTTKNGVNQGESNRYYLIPYFEYSEEYDDIVCGIYLTLLVPKKDFSKMERASELTRKFDNYEVEWPTETFITYEGIIEKFSKDEKKNLQTYVDEGYIDSFVLKPKNKAVLLIGSGAAVLGVLIGLLLVILGIKQGKIDSDNRKALAASNYYQAPTNVSFNNDPNAAQAQAPQGGYNPYGIQNDPRFAGAINNAQSAAQSTVQNASNMADQAVTSFNEVNTEVQEAATTSFNEVPISPIADVPPINPENKQ